MRGSRDLFIHHMRRRVMEKEIATSVKKDKNRARKA